jgi:hypothetical protein
MKKWLVLILVVIVAFLITIYFMIPRSQEDSFQTTFACTPQAVTRQIINTENWQNWWPGKKVSDSIYSFKNYNYKIGKILLNGFHTTVYNDKDSIKGLLQFIYFGMDSTQFKWTSDYHFSKNPLNRIKESNKVKKLNDNVVELILDIKKYFSSPENVYGMKIVEDKIKDSTMITVKQMFDHYPGTEEIYTMIHSVQKYIRENNGEQTNFPMLNVHKEGQSRFQVMVGIPTRVDLPAKGNFELKKMVLGMVLRGEVKGGVERVKEGEKELAYYVTDHHKYSPAIPFQSLVTDRIAQADSTQWITRLYYPVFY